MAAQLSTKLTMDGTQHNDALRGAAKELSKYKREVENTDKQLKMFKQQSQSATGAVNTFATSFKNGNVQGMMIGAEGATKALGGTLVKLGGWFGVAMGATEAFNKVLHSSQTIEDAFGETQAQVTTVVDNFFQAISSGDFSSFINGMDNMVGKAREAYQAMDDLWNMAQSFSVQNARLNNKFQANLIEIRQKKNSKNPEDKKRVAALTSENQKIIQQQARGGMTLYNQTIKGLQKEIAAGTGMSSNITEGAIYRIVENDINNLKSGRAKYAKEYKKYLAEVDKMNNQADRKQGRYFMGRTGVNYSNDLKKLQQQYGESIAANYLLQRKSDEELQQFNDKLKQGLSYQGTSLANQSKMLRYTKEMNSTSGGSSNSGKVGRSGGSNTQKYAKGSVGWYDEQIALKQKEIKFQVDSSEIERLQKEIKDLISLREQLMNPIKPLPPVEMPVIPLFKAPDLNQKIQIPEIKVPTVFDQYDEIRNKMDNVMNAYDMGAIGAKKAQEFIDELNAQLEALGLKPIKIHVESDAERTLGDISEVAGQMSDAFSGLGEAMNLPELDAAGIISGAIASVLQGYGTATAQASSLGPWAWIAFAIAGMAQVATMISQIHSLSGYAEGGVIQGRTTIGDYNFARVNAGEMILNTKQQNHLFKMIDEGRTGLHQSMGGEVIFRIHGKDLEGVRRNYNDKMNKVR